MDNAILALKNSPSSPLYLQPERIDPSTAGIGYTIQSDVWSFGITLVRPTSLFPYSILCTLKLQSQMSFLCPIPITVFSNLHSHTSVLYIPIPLYCQTPVFIHLCAPKTLFPLFHTLVLSNLHSFSTQVELALGSFPYGKWTTIFEQLNAVVNGPAPNLPENDRYSPELREFGAAWYVTCVKATP